ncbi:MAG: porin family protein [Bacteroidota bacterium]
MEKLEDNFSNSWRDAFEGQSKEPPNAVWVGVENALIKDEAKNNKIIVFWYKMAASISLMAMFTLGVLYFNQVQTNLEGNSISESQKSTPNTNPTNQNRIDIDKSLAGDNSDLVSKESESTSFDDLKSTIASNQNTITNKNKQIEAENTGDFEGNRNTFTLIDSVGNNDLLTDLNEKNLPNSSEAVASSALNSNRADRRSNNDFVNQDGRRSNEQKLITSGSDFEELNSREAVLFADHQLPLSDNYDLKPKSSPLGSFVSLQEPDELYKVPVEKEIIKKKSDSNLMAFWAGVDVGSGSYSPNSSFSGNTSDVFFSDSESLASLDPSVEGVRFDLNNTGLTSGEESSGSYYSAGINFGLNLTSRWSIQSGLAYANYGSGTSTNLISEQGEEQVAIHFSNLTELDNSDEVLFTENVNLDNRLEFVSVPLIAGYAVVNRKWKLIINAGLSSDFFVQNTLSGVNGLSDQSISSDDNTGFRDVVFRGITGLELNYPFAKNYSFTLQPNVRFSLNEATLSETNITSRPNIFGVNLGVRYLFGK